MQTRFRAAVLLVLIALPSVPQGVSSAGGVQRTLSGISAESLRTNLSFLASDLLEGRDTPSPGLEIAARYIAAQFRKAHLETVENGAYYQTARMLRVGRPPEGFTMQVASGDHTITVARDQALVIGYRSIDLHDIAVYQIRDGADLARAALRGQAAVLQEPADGPLRLARAAAVLGPALFLEPWDSLGPAVVRRLIDPDQERAAFGGIPRVILRNREAIDMLQAAGSGRTAIRVSIHSPAPANMPVVVRNVAGILRGADPVLRHQYVILSAHYDHLGRDRSGAIDPGANDDGSGTVSVIEIAGALSRLAVHPKRSILFLLFFGEEEGSLGSRYYVNHPLVPLSATVADLNLEQLGRTDSATGSQVGNATLTGFRYSTVSDTLQRAGALTGVDVYETPNDDEYFRRSDNLPFAEHGIPAHTVVVALDFPDYHAPGDTWQKIDYGNLAKVDHMLATATLLLANAAHAPVWNTHNPEAVEYMHAR